MKARRQQNDYEHRVRAKYFTRVETKERSEKGNYRSHRFRAAPSFRADIANATTNSSLSTGNVRKYSERHINGNFLVVLPLISRVCIDLV